MIQLNPRNLLVRTQDGQEQFLDTDDLCLRLAEAFRQCAIDEAWIAETIIDVLENKVQMANQSGVLLQENEIQEILVSALKDSGYSDVASCFARSANAPSAPEVQENCGTATEQEQEPQDDCQEWTTVELHDLLISKLQPSSDDLEYLLLELPAVLRLMALPAATPSLILELSAHLLRFRSVKSAASPLSLDAKTQYISAEEWHLHLPPEAQQLLDRGVLKLMPVSDILPAAVVECNLSKLYSYPDAPQLELDLLTRLQNISTLLLGVLSAMGNQMAAMWPHINAPTAQVRFTNFEAFLQHAYPLPESQRRKKGQYRLKIKTLLRSDLCHSSTIPVTLFYP